MRIKDLYIYGFGKWIDYEISFGKASFVLIYGENEAGKSSLQKFILFILFGLPPRMRKYYRPKQSSRMGGRMTVIDEEIGEFTIERTDDVENGAAICYFEGKTYDEQWLKKRLKGVTEDVFQSIYSFSLEDLREFSSLRNEDLSDLLLSISLTGSSNIYTLEKQLEQSVGEYFKPYGKNPKINQQLTVLQELQQKVDHAANEERTYVKKKQKFLSLQQRIENEKEKLQIIENNLLEIERKERAFPFLQQYKEINQKLQKIPEHLPFPINGLKRLADVEERYIPIKSEYEIVKQTIDSLQDEISNYRGLLLKDSFYEKLKNIEKVKQMYQERKEKLASVRQAIEEIGQRIRLKIEESHLNLTPQSLDEIHFTFYTEKTWQDLQNMHKQLMEQKVQLDYENKMLMKQIQSLRDEKSKIEHQLFTPEHLKQYEEIIHVYEKKERSNVTERNIHRKNKIFSTIFGVTIIGTVLLFFLAYERNHPLLYQLMVLVLSIGCIQFVLGKYMIHQMKKMFGTKDQQILQLSESEYEERKQILEQQERLKREHHYITDQLKRNQMIALQLEEKCHLFQQQYERFQKHKKEQIEQFPFLAQIEVDYWGEVYHIVYQLKNARNEQLEFKTRYEQFVREQKEATKKITAIVKKLDPSQSVRGEEMFPFIEQIVEDQKEYRIRIRQLEKQLIEYREKLRNLTEKLTIYEDTAQKLFAEAEVENEEEFYVRADLIQQREVLKGQLEDVKKQCTTILNLEEIDSIFNQSMTLSTIHQLKQSYELERETLTKNIDELVQEQADLNASIKQMETSGNYSELLYAFDMEKEYLNKLSMEWAVVKTAKEMLTRAKDEYMCKYLPTILEMTTQHFQTITENRYVKVFAPTKDQPFRVQDQRGFMYHADELSSGTIDQLYISLRFALNHFMMRRQTFPFLVDDAFLNFDYVRMERMIHLLQTISSDQQMLIFTCRKELTEKEGFEKAIFLSTNEPIIF